MDFKKNKNTIITIVIIIVILAFVAYIKFKPTSVSVSEELARCIGNNSIVYSQIGCSHCIDQEKMFGDNAQYLNIFVCNTDWQVCSNAGVEGTPTWLIKGQLYAGVQSVDKLKELTGC